jgi:Membrane-associated lipoprotein involved in thiamine biosynthesis
VSGETALRFGCFGAVAAVHVGGSSPTHSAEGAAERSRQRLLEVHRSLSRFITDSELSRLNRSPLTAVAAGPLMCSLARAAVAAARRSGGLVDATQLGPLERAGYEDSMEETATLSLELELALAAAPPRRPASPDPQARWRTIEVDQRLGTVSRPPGLRLDSGGIAKGLAADLVAASLRAHPTFAIDCAGDIRIGGAAALPRRVLVDDPFGGEPLHELEVTDGAVATSGIGRRAWLRPDGSPAHHLLDPESGQPAFTGIVQVTALAPIAQLAEVLAKTALLRGPQSAARELPYGGVLVFDDRSFEVVRGLPTNAALTIPVGITRLAA